MNIRSKHSWQPFYITLFSSFIAFLNISVASKERRPFMLTSIDGKGGNQLDTDQVSMGDAPLLSHCSWLRSTWPKPTGVQGHGREGETDCLFSISRGVSF
jgi:hypothetical protein